jgi:D-aminoacyl-tRNA deacylase
VRLVIQRVSSARVDVEGVCRGRIGRGLLVLAGLVEGDTDEDVRWGAEKIAHLRIFEDEQGKMNRSVVDLTGEADSLAAGAGGGSEHAAGSGAAADASEREGAQAEPGPIGVLLVPNFTLAGDARKGRRPSFDRAMKPESASPMFEDLCRIVGEFGVRVERGVFRATMAVSLVNDGPVTIVVDSRGVG